MLRFNRLVCLLVVCSLVGVVYGAARISSFSVFDGRESADADGMAILNYASGNNTTLIQVILSGLTAGRSYDVGLIPDGAFPADCDTDIPCGVGFNDDAFEADQEGHGTFHGRVPGNFSHVNIGVYTSFFVENLDGSFTRRHHMHMIGNP